VKAALLVAAGLFTGLMIFYHIPRGLDEWSTHGLPPEWTGPRYRHWKNGVEIVGG
jgi:hypothetical protein